MFLDLINLAKVRRAILCALTLAAVMFFQDVVLSHLVILGVRPMITPIAVVAVGFWNGGVWGGVFGIIAGIFTDMGLSNSSVMMTVIFPLIGFFAGALPMYFLSRRLMSFMSVSVAALALTAFCQMFRYLVFTDTQIWPLFLTALLQVLWSVPFVFAIYYPCRSFSRIDLNK